MTAAALLAFLTAAISNAAKGTSGAAPQIPETLRQLAQVENLSVPDAVRAFKQGLDYYLHARYAEALQALPDEQAAVASTIGDYILLYRARANFMSDHDKEALDDFRLLASRYPDSPLIQDALAGQCQVLLKLNNPGPVLSILKDARIGKDSETRYFEARALQLAGEKEKAIERYLSIYSEYPKSDSSTLAERNLKSLSRGALLGRRGYMARLQRAENLLRAGDVRSARALLLALGRAAAPDSAGSQKRSLLFADAEYRLGKPSIALAHLRKITAKDPEVHAKAVRLEGSCYRKLDKEQELLAQRDKALKLYPLSRETEELCYATATYFDINCNPAKGQGAYRVLYERYPKGRYAERSLWKLALFHYFEKEYGKAAQGFWHYLTADPNPQRASSAMYWMGRCYEKLGGVANAKYLYGRVRELANNSYFGQCARKAEDSLPKSGIAAVVPISGIDFEKVAATCNGIRIPAIQLPEPGQAAIAAIERARQLWSAGSADLAVFELQSASRRFPQDQKAIAYIVSQIHAGTGNYHRAIASVRGMFPDYASRPAGMLPEEIWRLLFPIRYWDIISARAAKSQLDPSLILGIIRQESAFNENAHSSADARGLMQVLAATGTKLARQARIRPYNAKKLYQAETNIILGTDYLDSLVRRYGRVDLVLAAYNAGNSRVDLWLKAFGDADMPEFIEQIPFSETRGYIKQVLSNQAIYASFTSSSAAPEN